MSALWTRSDQPRTAFFAEFGSVTVLMLALRTVHSLLPISLRGTVPCCLQLARSEAKKNREKITEKRF